MAGWIKLHRKILDNPVFLNPELYQLFTYCLLRANHGETKIIWNGVEESIGKGCFISGRKVIASDTGQGESAVYKRLKILEKLNMISLKSNNRFSVVKVLNYGVYQGEELDVEQQSNNKVTTKEQQSNTDKNVKNDKNDKNISSSQQNKFADDAIEFILASELFNLILSNNPKAIKPNLQAWAKEIDKMIRLDKRSSSDIRTLITWSQKDTFWQGNILSATALRKQFDKLTIQMATRDKPKTPNFGADRKPKDSKYDNFYL